MSIGQRIKELRNAKGLTMKQLSEILNIKLSNISRYEKDEYKPSADTIIALSQYFKVSADWLLTGHESNVNLTSNEQDLIENFRLLQPKEKYKVLGRIETYLEEYRYNSDEQYDEDIYTKEGTQNNITYLESPISLKYDTELWGEVSAGSGIDAIANREDIKSPVKCDFALRVVGDSMEPLYHDQQIIYLKHQPDIEQGQIAAIQIDDFIPVAYLKKVYKENSHIRLVSLNPIYEDKILPANQVRVLGIVLE